MTIDRRTFLQTSLLWAGLVYLFPGKLSAGDSCRVAHPFLPLRREFTGICSNCGMMQSMWARTWHRFEDDGEKMDVCSMHCLAAATMDDAALPEQVEAALYLAPEQSIPAKKAYYVLGSSARGTMAMESKLAFGSEREAKAFAGECGGLVARFEDTYLSAVKALRRERESYTRAMLSRGDIVEPLPQKDRCAVCGMYPASFPGNKCQLQTAGGKIHHFCSTQCLFTFLEREGGDGKSPGEIRFIWVTGYMSGRWLAAQTSAYVLGTDISGPMGKEALPFSKWRQAKRFAKTHSGTVLTFKEVTLAGIMA